MRQNLISHVRVQKTSISGQCCMETIINEPQKIKLLLDIMHDLYPEVKFWAQGNRFGYPNGPDKLIMMWVRQWTRDIETHMHTAIDLLHLRREGHK